MLLSQLACALLAVGARAANDSDLVWRDNPRAWHQQIARIVDHRFTTFDELARFSRDAKRAGVSVVMLVQVQKTAACPGWWYNGLQLCDHINGTVPAADGTLDDWQALVAELRPMRFMWWTNMDYWSTQGPVWAQAAAAPRSDVGAWFSWNASDADECWGHNPDGAQGSWGSDNSFEGEMSALASWGSAAYAEYLVDAMANSWTRNLGVDGYCIDCIGCYQRGTNHCASGMLQVVDGDAEAAWRAITRAVRARQPQAVFSGEAYGSWAEVIASGSDIGGQGWNEFHEQMQAAVFAGDFSGLEDAAAASGADAAAVLCYLDAAFDGEAPGACPTMYFRDATSTIANVSQHEMWVALEAASGIVPQHDYDPDLDAWWNVTNDPWRDGGGAASESPLWAFSRERALNRLALRTKLATTGTARGALAYLKHDAMGPRGDAAVLLFNPGAAGTVTVDLAALPRALDGAVPVDALARNASGPPLAASWTVAMGAGEMKFFAGFGLGVFAPRTGKKRACVADDAWSAPSSSTTLEACFLECLALESCENVFVEHVDVYWTEKPAAVACTLLGAVVDPAAACEEGTGTLVRKLVDGRPSAA